MTDFDDFLRFRKEIAEFELKTIKRYLKTGEPKTTERTSQFEIVKRILKITGRPTHISEITQIATNDFQLELERDSVVSMIIKKIKAGQGIIRTSPNTFVLK